MREKNNKEKLIQTIESDFTNLTKDDIKQLIDKELSKDVDDVDTDYVDLCFELLSMKESDISTQPKHKKIKVVKISMIAAAIILLASSIGLTAYAKTKHMKISDVFVKMYSDHATIYYQKKDNAELTEEQIVESELYKTLSDYGIENIMLPPELYSMPFEISFKKIDFVSTDLAIAFEDKRLYMSVCLYKDENYVGNPNINGEFSASKKVTIDGVDVYLFERNGDKPKKVNTSISYMVGLTEYFIQYDEADIEEAEKLINQMK